MVRACSLLTCGLLVAMFLVMPAASYPSPSNYYREEGAYEPEEIMDVLDRLRNILRIERKMENFRDDIASSNEDLTSANDNMTSDKRALDLGLNRGYSGALHAKHLMGMAAANFARGPGRRRRDAH